MRSRFPRHVCVYREPDDPARRNQHYSVADHVRAIYEHTRPGLFDYVVINAAGRAPAAALRAQGAEPVGSLHELNRMGLALRLRQPPRGTTSCVMSDAVDALMIEDS